MSGPPNTPNDAFVDIAVTPGMPASQSFQRMNFSLDSKKRRAYFSMILSMVTLGVFSTILFMDSTNDLKMVAISIISSLVGSWTSNLKAGKSANSDGDSI